MVEKCSNDRPCVPDDSWSENLDADLCGWISAVNGNLGRSFVFNLYTCLREPFWVESLSQLTNWTLFRYRTILMSATESGNSYVSFLRVEAPVINNY